MTGSSNKSKPVAAWQDVPFLAWADRSWLALLRPLWDLLETAGAQASPINRRTLRRNGLAVNAGQRKVGATRGGEPKIAWMDLGRPCRGEGPARKVTLRVMSTLPSFPVFGEVRCLSCRSRILDHFFSWAGAPVCVPGLNRSADREARPPAWMLGDGIAARPAGSGKASWSSCARDGARSGSGRSCS